MRGVLELATVPRDLREWDQQLRLVNKLLKADRDQLILSTAATIAERTGTDLATVLSWITDAGKAEDQRFLPQVSAGNVLSLQSVNPLTSDADATTAEIAIASHTLQYGFGTVSYNSGTITGLTPDTDYYVYADDPNYAGGAVTYLATTTRTNVTASNGRYFVGAISTTIAATVANLTAATNANPCAITVSAAHGWSTGQQVTFASVGGMTQLNGNTYTITVTGATTFTLDGVDSTAFGVYTSGGTATRVAPTVDGGTGGGGGWVDNFYFNL